MLCNASAIKGYAIEASDGQLGTVSDLLFDDSSWLIRWLVVDTGSWLSGRKVLLPPSVLGHPDSVRKAFSVRLTMQQVEDSPSVDTELSVSRQLETNVYHHYGWSPYWGGDYVAGYIGGYLGDMSGVTSPMPLSEPAQRDHDHLSTLTGRDNSHLQSIDVVTGYHVQATDGAIGHIEDFLLEDADWSVRYLVVDTSNWWLGKKVLISPRSAQDIDWSSREVSLNFTRQKVKDGPVYDAATLVDRAYERDFHGYYNRVSSESPRPK